MLKQLFWESMLKQLFWASMLELTVAAPCWAASAQWCVRGIPLRAAAQGGTVDAPKINFQKIFGELYVLVKSKFESFQKFYIDKNILYNFKTFINYCLFFCLSLCVCK